MTLSRRGFLGRTLGALLVLPVAAELVDQEELTPPGNYARVKITRETRERIQPSRDAFYAYAVGVRSPARGRLL